MNEKKYKRIFTVVIDSLGAGEMPDAASYGDAGTDTLGHIAANVEEFKIPNLQKLGIANLKDLAGVAPVEKTLAYYGKLREASNGKDTMTGHWEMMGLHITTPFKTFTETGFPKELIDELSKRTGRTIIGNKSASGTEILDELTEEEKIKMCEIVTKAGAEFIKTSTGFSTAGATFEDVKLMHDHVGEGVKVKAAGGISSFDDAEKFMSLGADRLGTSRLVKIMKNTDNGAGSLHL
mgnify:FL=1